MHVRDVEVAEEARGRDVRAPRPDCDGRALVHQDQELVVLDRRRALGPPVGHVAQAGHARDRDVVHFARPVLGPLLPLCVPRRQLGIVQELDVGARALRLCQGAEDGLVRKLVEGAPQAPARASGGGTLDEPEQALLESAREPCPRCGLALAARVARQLGSKLPGVRLRARAPAVEVDALRLGRHADRDGWMHQSPRRQVPRPERLADGARSVFLRGAAHLADLVHSIDVR